MHELTSDSSSDADSGVAIFGFFALSEGGVSELFATSSSLPPEHDRDRFRRTWRCRVPPAMRLALCLLRNCFCFDDDRLCVGGTSGAGGTDDERGAVNDARDAVNVGEGGDEDAGGRGDEDVGGFVDEDASDCDDEDAEDDAIGVRRWAVDNEEVSN